MAPPKIAKAANHDDDEDTEMFDDDDMELVDAAEEMESQENDNSGESQEFDATTTVSYSEWERPPVPITFCPSKSSLSFQQLDMDHYIGKPIAGMPGASVGPVPVIR